MYEYENMFYVKCVLKIILDYTHTNNMFSELVKMLSNIIFDIMYIEMYVLFRFCSRVSKEPIFSSYLFKGVNVTIFFFVHVCSCVSKWGKK